MRKLTAILVLGVLASSVAAQSSLPSAFAKPVPDGVADLQAIEKHVQALVEKLTPATVCLRVGASQGSGVIIDRDGHILTAGHVSGKAGQECVVILHDGRRLRGKTLGANHGIDSGMIVITDNADFSYAAMANAASVNRGDWCLSLGHPGGFRPGRAPVVRLGRLQQIGAKALVSDCALVGGDSGGPLFDMHGRVIGIHSRIGDKVSANVHVPIDTYRATWDRLTASEVWGGAPPLVKFAPPEPGYLGVRPMPVKNGLRVEAVTPGSPAESAGLRTNDVILAIDNRRLATPDDLGALLKSRRPGMRVNVHVRRAGEVVAIAVTLGKRGN